MIGAWTVGLTGGRGWIALGLVTFANWHPLWAIAGTLLFGGFEAAQFRLPAPFPGSQYLLGIFPYLAPIVTLPLIAGRLNLPRAAPRPPSACPTTASPAAGAAPGQHADLVVM